MPFGFPVVKIALMLIDCVPICSRILLILSATTSQLTEKTIMSLGIGNPSVFQGNLFGGRALSSIFSFLSIADPVPGFYSDRTGEFSTRLSILHAISLLKHTFLGRSTIKNCLQNVLYSHLEITILFRTL